MQNFLGWELHLSTVHEFSSEPSAQSGEPLQNNSFSIQSPFPQANLPVSQIGSSVANKGVASRGSELIRENID